MPSDSYAIGYREGNLNARPFYYGEGLRKAGRMGKIAYWQGYKAGYQKGFRNGRNYGYKMCVKDRRDWSRYFS